MDSIKSLLAIVLTFLSSLGLEACSVNPATGEKQFAALMSPQQEVSVGASEHQKIEEQYGFIKDAALVNYVNQIGQRVTRDTERPDVEYKFFVLDSPIVNAFALPGGYIYVSRGLLALANNEAELASVLGHEAGHITARHTAERYSKGVVTSLGTNLLSIAIGNAAVSDVLGVGANLYLSSYSRTQENQADSLGIRYMTRAGYDAQAVPAFLESLQKQSQLEDRMRGRSSSPLASYFSTHPATGDRVALTNAEVAQHPKGGDTNRSAYLKAINGLIYGDSAEHGFVRGQSFVHPVMGFAFDVPEGFNVENQPAQVVMTHPSGAAAIFDMQQRKGGDALSYLRSWPEAGIVEDSEAITIQGMPAATGTLEGQVGGRPVTIRLVAIEWGNQYARFQIIIPKNASAALIEDLKRTTYSFRSMSAEEKNTARPQRLVTFTAGSGDTVAARAARLPFSQFKEERFRVLNGLGPDEELQSGQMYKTVEG